MKKFGKILTLIGCVSLAAFIVSYIFVGEETSVYMDINSGVQRVHYSIGFLPVSVRTRETRYSKLLKEHGLAFNSEEWIRVSHYGELFTTFYYCALPANSWRMSKSDYFTICLESRLAGAPETITDDAVTQLILFEIYTIHEKKKRQSGKHDWIFDLERFPFNKKLDWGGIEAPEGFCKEKLVFITQPDIDSLFERCQPPHADED